MSETDKIFPVGPISVPGGTGEIDVRPLGAIKPPEPEGWISGGARAVASGLTEWGPMHVTMAPIVLGVGFLFARAAVIRSHPKEQREAARRALGVWPRLMIVLSFMWSGFVTLAIAFLNGKVGEIGASLPLAYLTFIPVLALWMIYFAARWVRQGAKAA